MNLPSGNYLRLSLHYLTNSSGQMRLTPLSFALLSSVLSFALCHPFLLSSSSSSLLLILLYIFISISLYHPCLHASFAWPRPEELLTQSSSQVKVSAEVEELRSQLSRLNIRNKELELQSNGRSSDHARMLKQVSHTHRLQNSDHTWMLRQMSHTHRLQNSDRARMLRQVSHAMESLYGSASDKINCFKKTTHNLTQI